ncbi:MAG: hypothetical protein U0794_13260 [Isosphaeraceae bacterium]
MKYGRSPISLSVGLGILTGAVILGGTEPTRAQTVGFGSSPGRAAYRPAGQWNNGPFYTVGHWDPWSPRPAHDTGLYYSRINEPPFNSEPRGVNSTFEPGRGATHPYAQGFSPFSGYADWYRRTYGFTPTNRELAQATRQYFQSSVIPPSPSYLAPRVAQAYYQPTSVMTAPRFTTARTTTPIRTSPVVVQPLTTVPRSTTPRTMIYRFQP